MAVPVVGHFDAPVVGHFDAQDCLSLKPYEKKLWLELDVNEMKSSSLAMLPCRDLDGASLSVSCHKEHCQLQQCSSNVFSMAGKLAGFMQLHVAAEKPS